MMKTKPASKLRDGAQCKVIGGTHEGKSGTVRDIKTGKTGYVSITVVQSNGERFKTVAKNVVIQTYAAQQGAGDNRRLRFQSRIRG
jgi:ribosomal protein S4E